MKKRNFILFCLVSVLLLAGCATSGGAAAAGGDTETATPVFYGRGTGDSSTKALNAAKMDALRKAVETALGPASAAANKDKLTELLYNTSNPNAFVINGSMEVIKNSGDGGSFYYEIGIQINLEATANFLRSKDIIGGRVLLSGGPVLLANQPRPEGSPPDSSTAEAAKPAAEGKADPPAKVSADPEEAKIVKEIIDNLTYMVYFDEETGEDPFLMKAVIGMANKFLSENGMDYIDMSQIESIKKDQELAYEEETGEGISMIQWIAGKLNADIYIEIGAEVSSKKEGRNYYGSASITLKNYDASTAAGRGTAFYQTIPPAMSTVSSEAAINNAVTSATYRAMENAIAQAREFTQRELVQGIKYDLVIQSTPDSRLMRDFMKKIERKVKSIERISASAEETRYSVRMIGGIMDLEDLVYDIADNLPGLEGIAFVYTRGNSITFHSGL